MMRVAAVLHALFSLDPEHDFTTELSAASVKAALDMVEVCNKHTKIIAGRTDTSSSPTTRKNNRHQCIIIKIYWVIYTTAQTSHLRGKSVIDIGRHRSLDDFWILVHCWTRRNSVHMITRRVP